MPKHKPPYCHRWKTLRRGSVVMQHRLVNGVRFACRLVLQDVTQVLPGFRHSDDDDCPC